MTCPMQGFAGKTSQREEAVSGSRERDRSHKPPSNEAAVTPTLLAALAAFEGQYKIHPTFPFLAAVCRGLMYFGKAGAVSIP